MSAGYYYVKLHILLKSIQNVADAGVNPQWVVGENGVHSISRVSHLIQCLCIVHILEAQVAMVFISTNAQNLRETKAEWRIGKEYTRELLWNINADTKKKKST